MRASEARSLSHLSNTALVKQSNFLPAFQAGAIESDKISIFGKWRGKSFPAVLIPTSH